MLINSKHSDPTVPINYIYAGQMVDDKFDGFYKFLKEMGYEDFETRDKSPKSPKDESDTIRTVVKGYDVWGGEQLRGVIVNPSYPWAPGHPGPQFLNRRGRLSSLLTALAAGAVLATLVSRLGRNQ